MQSRYLFGVAWICVGIFLLADLIWFPLSRLTFAPAGLTQVTQVALMVAAIAWIPELIRYRLRADEGKIARYLVAGADGTSLMIHIAVLNLALFVVGVTFAHLSISLALPLRDAELASIDRALGFDWPGFLRFTNSYPIVATVLTTAYHTSVPQLVLLFVFLSSTRRRERLAEFLALLALTTLITGMGLALVPAEGAYAFYHPPAEDFSNFAALGQTPHEVFTELRTQLRPIVDFNAVKPLVTFPSYHTIVSVIMTYAVRDIRYLAPPAIALNFLVVVATIPEGGHHLIDVIAGLAIAAASIVFIRRLRSSFSYAGMLSAQR